MENLPEVIGGGFVSVATVTMVLKRLGVVSFGKPSNNSNNNGHTKKHDKIEGELKSLSDVQIQLGELTKQHTKQIDKTVALVVKIDKNVAVLLDRSRQRRAGD